MTQEQLETLIEESERREVLQRESQEKEEPLYVHNPYTGERLFRLGKKSSYKGGDRYAISI